MKALLIELLSKRKSLNSTMAMPYAKKVFRSKLTPKELELATAFYGRRGYFAYLEEIGLIDVFREAEDEAVWVLIEEWEEENGLSIDWDTVYIA